MYCTPKCNTTRIQFHFSAKADVGLRLGTKAVYLRNWSVTVLYCTYIYYTQSVKKRQCELSSIRGCIVHAYTLGEEVSV